ncbi:hypothetical protein NOC27_2569 [Nitrosococcus oceani AFC27]|nr:hypothetical protein NOC27_2569 [Nitrosococcus oceani AFC27]
MFGERFESDSDQGRAADVIALNGRLRAWAALQPGELFVFAVQ